MLEKDNSRRMAGQLCTKWLP